MNDESEYYSIHDQMRDLVQGNEKKIIEKPKLNDLDDIRLSLKYILDKLSTMDRFIRSKNYSYGDRVMDGQKYEGEVIRKFLERIRWGEATSEEKSIFKLILSQDSPKKEIT